MDLVAYAPLPSAPPADSAITVKPEILTIRFVTPEPAATNRQWGLYCCFIVVAFIFGCAFFYYMMFSTHKN